MDWRCLCVCVCVGGGGGNNCFLGSCRARSNFWLIWGAQKQNTFRDLWRKYMGSGRCIIFIKQVINSPLPHLGKTHFSLGYYDHIMHVWALMCAFSEPCLGIKKSQQTDNHFHNNYRAKYGFASRFEKRKCREKTTISWNVQTKIAYHVGICTYFENKNISYTFPFHWLSVLHVTLKNNRLTALMTKLTFLLINDIMAMKWQVCIPVCTECYYENLLMQNKENSFSIKNRKFHGKKKWFLR